MRKLFFVFLTFLVFMNAGVSAQEKTRLSVFPFENKSEPFYDWMGYGFSYLVSEALNATQAVESVPQDSIYSAESDPNVNLKNIYAGTVSPSFLLYQVNWKTDYVILGDYAITGDTAVEISYKFCVPQKKALTQPYIVKGKFGKYTDMYLTYLKFMESVYAGLIGFDVVIDRPGVENSHDRLRNLIAGYDGLQVYIKKWLAIRHYDNAVRLTGEKNYGRAVDYFNLAAAYDEARTLNISQNLSKTHVLRGASFYADKKLDEAEKDFLLSVSLDSGNADAYYNLGNVYKDKNDFDNAELNYQKAVTANPSMTAAYVNLGYVFGQQGDYNASVKAYEKARTLDGKNALLLYYTGVAYDNMNDLVQAKQNYEEALKMDSTIAGAHLNLGIICKLSKDIVRAKACYQRALTYDPNSALAHRNLGILLMNNKKEAAQALVHLERTLELDPDQDDAAAIRKNADILKKKTQKKKKK